MSRSVISDGLFRTAVKNRIPINGSFELTANCNFNCRMCYVHNCSKKALLQETAGADRWVRLLRQCAEKGLTYALITGGEPLVHPEFERIYDELSGQKILTTLNTNGYLMDAERIRFFKEKPPTRINVTLYGTSNRIYEELCGVKDGFDVVSGNLDRLKESGFNVCLNLTVTKSNLSDLENLVNYAMEQGFPIRPTTFIFGTDPNCREERTEPEIAAMAAVKLFRLTHTEEEYRNYAVKTRELLAAGERTEETRAKLPAITCRAGTASYWVHSDGKLDFCGMVAHGDAPDAFGVGFEEAWKIAVKTAEQSESYGICEKCRYRYACRKCYAMLQCEGIGQENVWESYACRYHRAYAEELKRIGDEYENLRCQ